MRRRPYLLTATLTAAIAAAVPAVARATLVYDKGVATASPSVWAAHDDGSGPRRIGPGSEPDLSPDGSSVVYVNTNYRYPQLLASSIATPAPRVLVRRWRGYGTTAWSPDSSTVATVTGPELGKKSLVLVDVATGAATEVASGYFGGVSFSPDSAQVVFARSAKDDLRQDLYRYDRATASTVALTTDHKASSPLWGPRTVVFTRKIDAAVRRYGPKGELYTIAPTGGRVTRVTHQRVGQLLFGLTATAFSADGTRLLAQFGGQDTSYAQVVNPATGRVRTLGRATEQGLQGLALSADGRTVLAATGGFEPQGGRHDIIATPYGGVGRVTVLVHNAFHADWDR